MHIPPRGYPAIADHAAIGNLRTAALVAGDGGIDWWCPPDFDSPSVFAAILDDRRGGIFRVSAEGVERHQQRYLPATNVVQTRHYAPRGRLTITDFMPLTGDLDGQASIASDEVVRILEADGAVTVRVEWSPRFDYARQPTSLTVTDTGVVASGGKEPLVLEGLPGRAELVDGENGPVAIARFTLRHGQTLALTARWGSTDRRLGLDDAMTALHETTAAWRGWLHKEDATGDRSWAGAWADQVVRSELALKLLSYAPTGAIVAAATTSLPEWIGGIRNWDYRYSWIRDSALTAQAMFALGHAPDAEAFIRWSERSARDVGEEDWGLRIVYGIRGEVEIPENELGHLSGYMGSSPVRQGNGAHDQLQLDVYGELISAAYELLRMGGQLPPDVLEFLPHVADQACAQWQQPDYGIWEVRNGPAHFVYSKAMVWMALDRALTMARSGSIEGDVQRWRDTRADIAARVLEEGYDPDLGAFTQRFGAPSLDASNLLLPLMEILPFQDPRVQSTIDRTLEHLTERDLVYRYHADDGLPGHEGAMGLCTFWMVDALALSGRLDEAYRIFDAMAARANPAGLFSEQIDPQSGDFLGNFPQAFTHMGLINSALYLAFMEGRETPVPAPIGSDAHRSGGG